MLSVEFVEDIESAQNAMDERGKLDKAIYRAALKRVVRQLLEALFFEKCMDYVAADCDYPVDIDKHHQKFKCLKTFYFSVFKRDYICRGAVRAFDRVDLDVNSLCEIERGKKTAVSLSEFMFGLIHSLVGEAEAKSRLLDELFQTAYWLAWNQQNLPVYTHRHALPFIDMEASLVEGHSYHPCSKARTGFSLMDHVRFGYENAQPFRLHWIAVPKKKVCFHYSKKIDAHLLCNDFLKKEFPGCLNFQEWGKRFGLDFNDYCVIPVHPWQWRNYLQAELKKHPNGCIHYLGEAGDFFVASQSQRTLLNVTRPGKADIKLPLNIVCTSSRRHLLSHGISAAPSISDWLYQVVREDDFYQLFPLHILREYAGVRVHRSAYDASVHCVPAKIESRFDEDSAFCQLGAIWRESVLAVTEKNEQAVPLTALLMVESNGKPLMHEWVRNYDLTSWLLRLLEVVVLPIWHLVVKHGIALEAHGQNAIVILKDGWPARLALRDFHESLEYVPEFLANNQQPDFSGVPEFSNRDDAWFDSKRNEYYWMESLDALRELVMDTLFVFYFSDVAKVIATHYPMTEQQFWAHLNSVLKKYEASEFCDLTRLHQLNFRSATVRVESLIRKKLWDAPKEEYHHKVNNPFAEVLELA